MRRVVTLFTTLALLLTITGTATAVDFQDELKKLAEENAKEYISPFATAFGTSMNSGLYHTAKPHGILGFDVSFKIALVSIPDDATTFEFMMPTVPYTFVTLGNIDVNLDGNILYPDRENPTVFGSSEIDSFKTTKESVEAAAEAALVGGGHMTQAEFDTFSAFQNWQLMSDAILNTQKFPGIDLSTMPFIMPQVSVGLPMETEVMLRFLPTIDAGDVGEVNFLGIGLKHCLSQYIPVPMFPVKISGQFVWQKLTIGDLLESKHTAFNIHASKTFGLGVTITPYVGLGFESSNLKVDYTIETGNPLNPLEGQPVSFDLDGDNSFRMALGLRVGLPMITLNADYNLGEYSTISAGLGFTLR